MTAALHGTRNPGGSGREAGLDSPRRVVGTCSFQVHGTLTKSRSLRMTLRKMDSLIRNWHWFSRSNQELLSFFISAKRPKINPVPQVHFRGLFSCQRLLSSLIQCFSLSTSHSTCQFQALQLDGHSSISTESHWEISTTSLSGISDLVSWPLAYSLRILTYFQTDTILIPSWHTLSSPWSMCSGISPAPLRISLTFWS